MKTCQSAVKDKDTVMLTEATNKLAELNKPFMTDFKRFCNNVSSNPATFKILDEYIYMVEVLLHFIGAEHSALWALH
jgi:hypothetical protein